MGVTPYVSTGRSGGPRADPTPPDRGLGAPPHGGVDTVSVAQNGFLYAEHSSHRVSKYASRSLLDETLDRETKPVWQRRHDRPYTHTVV